MRRAGFRQTARIGLAAALLAGGWLAACSGPAKPSEFERHALFLSGSVRVWYQYRPESAGHGRLPVLVLLHGFHEQPTDLPGRTGLIDAADRDGFVIVAPEGLDLSWNAGTCCGWALAHGVDDVDFLSRVISALEDSGVADPNHVYLAGFSNGAMMTYALACARADLLTAAAVVEGTITGPCPDHHSMDLLVVHQTGDLIVPFNGAPRPPASLGVKGPFPPVLASVATWLANEACPGRFDGFRPPSSAHAVARASVDCPGGTSTELEVLGGGTHAWPRGASLDATADLLRFFHLRS